VKAGLPVLPLRPIGVDVSAALAFSFPTSSSPDRPFALRLDGLTSHGSPLPAIDVEFERATGFLWDIALPVG
jgi:hypothetical protein